MDQHVLTQHGPPQSREERQSETQASRESRRTRKERNGGRRVRRRDRRGGRGPPHAFCQRRPSAASPLGPRCRERWQGSPTAGPGTGCSGPGHQPRPRTQLKQQSGSQDPWPLPVGLPAALVRLLVQAKAEPGAAGGAWLWGGQEGCPGPAAPAGRPARTLACLGRVQKAPGVEHD